MTKSGGSKQTEWGGVGGRTEGRRGRAGMGVAWCVAMSLDDCSTLIRTPTDPVACVAFGSTIATWHLKPRSSTGLHGADYGLQEAKQSSFRTSSVWMHLFEFIPASQLVEGEPRHRRSIYRSAYLDIRLREESTKGRRGLAIIMSEAKEKLE